MKADALNILVIGAGRMGVAVSQAAASRGHVVHGPWGRQDLEVAVWPAVDVAIEFTAPGSALAVMDACRKAGVPLVSGTTGWDDHRSAVEAAAVAAGHPMLWAPNFSVGIYLFRKALRQVQDTLDGHGFTPSIHEVHHTGKRDAPSGTALALQSDLLDAGATTVAVSAGRLAGVPGTHSVHWAGAVDRISLEHAAKDRSGFALGAVQAAEWLVRHGMAADKMFGMEDVWG